MILVATLSANSIWQAALAITDMPVCSTLQALDNATAKSSLIEQPVQLEELAAKLDATEQILLCYEAAEQRIATLLLAGCTVQQAANQWQAETTALLALQRQNRRKFKLLNLSQITQATVEQLADLQPYWPLTRAVAAPQVSIEQLAARLLLSQDAMLNELNVMLQVSSITLTNATDFDIEAALQISWAEQAQLKIEVETLREQYQQVEQLYQANAQTAEQLQQQLKMATEKHQQDVKQQEQIAKQHKQHLADAVAENELIIKQLMLVQEQFEVQYQAAKQLEQDQQSYISQLECSAQLNKQHLEQLAEADTKLNQYQQVTQQLDQHKVTLEKQLEEIKQQASIEKQQLEQQMAELAKQLELAKQQAATEKQQLEQQANLVAEQQSLRNENSAVLEQLFKVQEQLEVYYQRAQQAEQDKQRLQTQYAQQLKQQQREYTKLESQFNKQRAELAGIKYYYQQITTELKSIQNSTSWKMAAPVRVLSRAIKKVDKASQKLQQEVGLLFTSEFFDAEWYLNSYPDVKDAGINPAEHYLKYGAAEGRRPSAEFDGNWYLQRYPDVAESGANPLLHFIKFGRNEGRTASPKLLEDHSNTTQG